MTTAQANRVSACIYIVKEEFCLIYFVKALRTSWISTTMFRSIYDYMSTTNFCVDFWFFFSQTPWIHGWNLSSAKMFHWIKNLHDFLSIFVFSTNCEHFDQQRFYWKPFIAHVLLIIRKTRNDSNKSRNWNETQPKYSNMMYKLNIFKIVSIYDDTDIGRLAWIRNVFASILKRIDKTLAVYSIVTYLLCHNKSG